MQTVIPVRPAIFENENRIAVFIAQETTLIALIRQVPERRWSRVHNYWHFPKTQKHWDAFLGLFKDFNLNIQANLAPLSIPASEMLDKPKLELKANILPPIVPIVEMQLKPIVGEPLRHADNTPPPFKIEKVSYNKQTFIRLPIAYSDTDSQESVKKIEGRVWHPQEKAWILPYDKPTVDTLIGAFGNKLILPTMPVVRAINPPFYEPKMTVKTTTKIVGNTSLFDQLNHKQQLAVTKLENLLILERKASDTQKGYRNIFIQFLTYYKDVVPSQITGEQISTYILRRIKDENISKSTQNQIISTFKAFYGRVCAQHDKVNGLYRPNKEEHLPKGLDRAEVTKLFAQVGNLKHKCLLAVMYGGGLRVGEVVRLKWSDFDFEEKTVFIHNGKNYKDRYTLLSEKTIAYLKQYKAQYQTQQWVFESPNGEHYSERSVQLFFADALAKAHIDKPLSTHSLRHGFATQLLKGGTDIDFVRKVMGHASIKTTQIYLHVIKTELTKTRSPMDDIDI